MKSDNIDESLNLSNVTTEISKTSEYSNDILKPDPGLLSLACTNARSVVEKVDSLVTLFEEYDLHFALLTETWLTTKVCSTRRMMDLTIGANISFIRRDRGRRGGGVAIAYNPLKIKLKKFPVGGEPGTEIVCATGNTPLSKRKIALISVYIPPSVSGPALDSYVYTLVELMDNIKIKFPDALIFLGGDFNRKEMDRFCTAFPDMRPIEAGATRRGHALDEVYTNTVEMVQEKVVIGPLTKKNGVRSDHDIIVATVRIPKQKRVKTSMFSFRPITKKRRRQVWGFT